MDVTLIYVGVGVAGFNSSRPLGDREGSWIGHGIASIGASIKAAGHNVSLLDLRHFGGWPEVSLAIKQTQSQVFCLSVSPVDGDFAEPLCLLIKHFHPSSKTIIGGIQPTIFWQAHSKSALIDTTVVGEGEITCVDLINNFDSSWPRIVQGVKPDLDKLPWVDRELFDYNRELSCYFAPGQQLPSITMLAGRGCPYQCTYCQPAENSVFGKPYRTRSPQNVVDELVFLKGRYSFKSITFWDDTFTINKQWVSDFCDRYEAANIGASIAACSRADIVCDNETMIERLASIGVDWLVIGLESGSQRILDLIKKGTTVEQNIEAARICRKYGIKVFGTYMYGLPTETKEDSLQTYKMVKEIAPEHESPFFFRPIPGTDIFKLCEENDLLLSQDNQVARTGVFAPTIKNIDYDYLFGLLKDGVANAC